MFPFVPRRTDEEIRDTAEQFLDEYHVSREIPIPIEEIVELALGLDILPLQGFRQRYGIEGALTVDLSTIEVDAGTIKRNLNRYRFTLAHEVGHLVLHGEQIRALRRETRGQWKEAIRSIPRDEYSKMEYQAYQFAGCVLVPGRPLLAAYEEAARLAQRRGLDLAAFDDQGIEYVAEWIAKRFRVSGIVVVKRLGHVGIL